MLVKHQTYWMNLTEANLNGQATIRLEYDTKIDLGLKDMSPESWHVYVKNLAQDQVAFEQFRQRYYRHGPAYENSKCNKICKQNMLRVARYFLHFSDKHLYFLPVYTLPIQRGFLKHLTSVLRHDKLFLMIHKLLFQLTDQFLELIDLV